MSNQPYFPPNPLVSREKYSSANQTEADYDPRIIAGWSTRIFTQYAFPAFLVIATLFAFAASQTFGPDTLLLSRVSLKFIFFSVLLSNFFILPFTFFNFRCPRCGLYVGGQTNPAKPHRFYHFFPNLKITQCPHCLARLK